MQPNDQAGQGSTSLWGHPLVPVVISGMCSILIVSASVTFALLVAGRGLVQAANQVIWPFVVIVLASVTLCSLLHLFVLGRLTGEHLFRIDRRTLWKRTSPLIWMLLSAIVPAALCGQGGAVHPALVFGLLVSMVIGFIPTMLSLGRWETHLEARKEEVVELGLLDAADVPRGIRTFFDQHGPLLFRLGFEPLGDFRLKKHSMSMARFFLHRDSQTFAEINVSNTLISSVKAVCFFSLTEDGYYLESSNMPCSGKRTSKDGFELMSLPGLSIADVFSKHCQKLKERSGGRPLQVTAEDLQPVIHCGNKRLYEMLLEEGLVTSNPYADFDEQRWLSRMSPAPPTQPITFPAVWDGGVYADPQSFHLS